jgi:nitroreductase
VPAGDVLAVLAARRSVRDYTGDPVTDAEIEKLVEAAQCAPSATNRQPWRFFVVRNREMVERMAGAVRDRVARVKESIREEYRDEFVRYSEFFTGFARAPATVVGLYRSSLPALSLLAMDGPEADTEWLAHRLALDALIGVSAAMQNMATMATGLGLATCWMTGPLVAEREFLAILSVPAGWRIGALLAVGRARAVPASPGRRPRDKIYRVFD